MKRIVLTEGKPYEQTIPSLAKDLGIDSFDLINSLYSADSYLSKRLSLNSTLRIDRSKFSFSRVAGIFSVSNQLEVEVIPKFMSGDEDWRADFLLLLARTKWGLLAERQTVATSRGKDRGINDSLALVFLSMFDSVAHVPIRTYQRKVIHQFELEGDFDEETVLVPEKDGFSQTVTEFTRDNQFNSAIVVAAMALSNAVSDFDLRTRLNRAVHQLGGQGALCAQLPRRVPSRFRNWQDLYSLCLDILDGYGIDYINQGDVLSPGFVVRTSDAWEEMLRQALVSGMKNCSVAFQEKHPFARRDSSTVKVKPDYVVRSNSGDTLLVDAKYKYSDGSAGTISNADIYEGRAFIEATQINTLVLLYPSGDISNTKHFEEFQTVANDDWKIIGIRVNPVLVGRCGIEKFAEEIDAFLRPYLTC